LLKEDKNSEEQSLEGSRDGAQYVYTEEDKAKFRSDPEAFLAYRKRIEAVLNDTLDLFQKDTPLIKETKEFLIKDMHRRIGPGHEDLKKSLVPTFSPGCKQFPPLTHFNRQGTKPGTIR
jgi:hypothetical protein